MKQSASAVATQVWNKSVHSFLASGVLILLMVSLACGLFSSCARKSADKPLVIRVLVDPNSNIGKQISTITHRFGLAMLKKGSSKEIVVAYYVTKSYHDDLKHLSGLRPQVVILNRESEVSEISNLRENLGKADSLCGGMAAYIPDWTSPEERKAAQSFIDWLVSDCNTSSEALAPKAD